MDSSSGGFSAERRTRTGRRYQSTVAGAGAQQQMRAVTVLC